MHLLIIVCETEDGRCARQVLIRALDLSADGPIDLAFDAPIPATVNAQLAQSKPYRIHVHKY